MYKEAISHVFLFASKKDSTKLISKIFSNAFKLIFHQIQKFYNYSYFYFLYKHLWATENSNLNLEKIEKINCKANAKVV